MRLMQAQNNRAARPAFTLIELMVVVSIIIIVVGVGAAAYLRMVPEAQKRTAIEHLRTVAAAIQMYEQEKRDYPAMRFNDIIRYTATTGPAPWTDHNTGTLPNATQSVEALVYQLQYRSDAGKALSKLPAKVLRQVNNASVTDAGQSRPLYAVLDPWGNPIQYLRPREATPYDANYPLSAGRLNNRVLLVSMGPDGMPGNAGVNDEDPTAASPDVDIWQDDRGDTKPEWFPDPKELGTGDDIVVEVGATR